MTLPSHAEIELSLLQEILEAGGEAKPRDLYPRLRRHFPEITDSDLQLKLASTGGNLWTNRIQWARQHLVVKGDLYREPRGLWRITPRGRSRVEEQATQPTVSDSELSRTDETGPESPVVMVTDPVDVLCARLLKAQKQSSTPKNFEMALAEAFRFLDFDVKEQGGPGATDLILNSHIGPDSYRVIVDAKATHGDKIADSQINWLAIHQHQAQAQADFAAVIGADFQGGNLVKWASEYQVALIRTADLIDVVRMYRQAPYSLVDLKPLFSTAGVAQQSMQDLKLVHRNTVRHWLLLLRVVEQFANYNRFNASGLVATADGIQLMLYTRLASQTFGEFDPSIVPTKEDVKDAMAFLASRAVGVLKETPTGSGNYSLTMHLDGAVRRIQALSQVLVSGSVEDVTAVKTDERPGG